VIACVVKRCAGVAGWPQLSCRAQGLLATSITARTSLHACVSLPEAFCCAHSLLCCCWKLIFFFTTNNRPDSPALLLCCCCIYFAFFLPPAAALSIMPDMDEDTRARIRREKNRVAARKCRAKKMAFMVELQKTLRELMRKNEEYRLQVSCCLAILCLIRVLVSWDGCCEADARTWNTGCRYGKDTCKRCLVCSV
jgi:hypothetical protein